MELVAISSMLFMGLGWGMLHAFDPDHLAAVAGVSATDSSNKLSYFNYALRWSLGHGAAIASIAFLVFAFGYSLPAWFSEYAEHSVSFILILAGGLALIALFKSRESIIANDKAAISQRGAVIVGLVHGTAGSAPLLALIPLLKIQNPLLGMAYVLCFSAGVLLAMTCSGGILNYSIRLSSRVSEYYQRIVRFLLALFSIFVGFYLLI
ncbi:MAG: hypothetical protein KTR16_07585 [Acidiferrobacterales bacterium]|nr:hypothetical protein [Acidiferrobacterales bacterium]